MRKFNAAAVTVILFAGILGTGLAAPAEAQQPGAGIIPADRLTDWTPGVTVGVPGGIPTDRTHLIDVTKAPYNADNTGKEDAQPAIMKAIGDAKDNDVVYLPAGTYRIDRGIGIGGGKSRITIRGAGPDKTILKHEGPAEQRDQHLGRRRRLVVSGPAEVRYCGKLQARGDRTDGG